MKKIRDKIEDQMMYLERRWNALPSGRQRLFTKLFFAGYAVLTVLVVISIWISTANKQNTMFIGHISTISDHRAAKETAKAATVSSTIKKTNP